MNCLVNKLTKGKYVLLIIMVAIFASSCSKNYNTDFTPPANDAQPEDIFPAEIDGEKPELSQLEFDNVKIGLEARYGDNMRIYVARLKDKDEADGFFHKNIAPIAKEYSNSMSGTINGDTYAQGSSDGKEMFGWVNENWAFMIRAADEESMKKIVSSFKYVSEE